MRFRFRLSDFLNSYKHVCVTALAPNASDRYLDVLGSMCATTSIYLQSTMTPQTHSTRAALTVYSFGAL